MSRVFSFNVAIAALLATFCSAEIAMAQPGGRGGGGFFGGESGLALLSQEDVQKELEIAPDQGDQIKELQAEMRESMQETFSGMRDRFRDMDDSERQSAMEDIREKMKTSNEEFDAKAHEVLLPFQAERLKQLVAQAQNRRGGGISGGQLSSSLIEQLGITDEQIEAMKAKAEEVRAGLTEKINKLRAQAEEEILSVLDAAQQEKYRELVGEPFEFDNGGRGGPGGGRGGPGGGQGGPGGGQGGRGGDRGGQRGGQNNADNNF